MDKETINELKDIAQTIKNTYIGPKGPIADGLLILIDAAVERFEASQAKTTEKVLKNEDNSRSRV